MGSQLRMADAIMEKYSLGKSAAAERVRIVEALAVGDDIWDAIYHLTETGTPFHEALAELKRIHARLGEAIAAVEALPWPPRR